MELTLSDVICRDSKTISLERYEIGADGRRIPRTQTLTINFPQGITDGSRIRLPEKGVREWARAKWRSLYHDKAEKGSTLSGGSI